MFGILTFDTLTGFNYFNNLPELLLNRKDTREGFRLPLASPSLRTTHFVAIQSKIQIYET